MCPWEWPEPAGSDEGMSLPTGLGPPTPMIDLNVRIKEYNGNTKNLPCVQLLSGSVKMLYLTHRLLN